MRVVSWNLLTDTATEPPPWPERLPLVTAVLTELAPHAVGTQEGSVAMLDDLAAALGDRWAWVGEGRRGGRDDELTAVLVDTDRLDVRSWRTRWLSPTPEVPASTGWAAAFPRTLTEVHVRDRRDGAAYLLVNTHLDHVSGRARREGARLVAAAAAGAGAVVTGDFNAPADPADAAGPYAALTGAGLVDAVAVHDPDGCSMGSFPALAAPVVGAERIDWVLTSPDLEVTAARVVADGLLGAAVARGQHASDHLPVVADVRRR